MLIAVGLLDKNGIIPYSQKKNLDKMRSLNMVNKHKVFENKKNNRILRPVDLLLITWNRKEYVKKTLTHLLADSSDFNLYCWDNGSTDGAAEIVASFDDPRIVEIHQHPENVMQAEPSKWFLEKCKSNIIGKIDDDTLAPHGWIDTIAAAVDMHDELGMVGCWTFWPEDFERNRQAAIQKVVNIAEYEVLQNFWIGGTAFLMRRNLATKYLESGGGRAFPVNREQMSIDGYISGWYFPLLFADHMDDPRSIHCIENDTESSSPSALTARVRGFKTQEEFLGWIKNDADKILNTPFNKQLSDYRRNNSFLGGIKRRLARLF